MSYSEQEYDSDGSDVRYENLDEFDSSDKLRFDLYEDSSNPAVVEQGSLRSYGTREGGTALYYADKPSDYSIVADRILWVDGHESTTDDGQPGREMTLIVLKIALVSSDPDSKFKSFTAELSFKDKETHGDHEPIVEAWAPFRTMERWNVAMAQREVTDKKEVGVDVSYQGVGLSGTLGREAKMSWEQVGFDEGSSSEQFSRKTGRRNGVRWAVKQNDVRSLGVTPEIWVAVLLSRSSRQPYGVRFRLRSRGGSLHEVVQGTKRFFGTKPEETKPFSVTPWSRVICNSEGERILKAIDLGNLGKLRGGWGTNLILPLGPDHTQVPMVAEAGSGRGEEKATLPPESSAAPPPELVTCCYIPADPVRLAAMESRLAQAEARVATLEATVLVLRQALLDDKIKAHHLSA